MAIWIENNIAHESCETNEDVITWRENRAKLGETFLKNERNLYFGKQNFARIYEINDVYYIQFEGSQLSFQIQLHLL